MIASWPGHVAHVAQDIAWPCCRGHQAMLPRTSSGQVAQDKVFGVTGSRLCIQNCDFISVAAQVSAHSSLAVLAPAGLQQACPRHAAAVGRLAHV